MVVCWMFWECLHGHAQRSGFSPGRDMGRGVGLEVVPAHGLGQERGAVERELCLEPRPAGPAGLEGGAKNCLRPCFSTKTCVSVP